MRKFLKIILLLFVGFLLFNLISGLRTGIFCKKLNISEIETVISVKGQQYSSTVIHQENIPTNQLNYAGCNHQNKYGEAHVFRLPNDRIIIRPVNFCFAAAQPLKRDGQVEIRDYCKGLVKMATLGWVIDNADVPTKWREIRESDGIQLVSVTATRTRSRLTDNIEEISPALLSAIFVGHMQGKGIPQFGRRNPGYVLGNMQGRSKTIRPSHEVDYGDFKL